MMVRLLFFASLSDRFGARQVSLDLPENATVADALDALQVEFPDIAKVRKNLSVAVNHCYADTNRQLSAGDEVALIPPVSGG